MNVASYSGSTGQVRQTVDRKIRHSFFNSDVQHPFLFQCKRVHLGSFFFSEMPVTDFKICENQYKNVERCLAPKINESTAEDNFVRGFFFCRDSMKIIVQVSSTAEASNI